MNGKIERLKTNKFAVKLPINENIWIKYSFADNIILGINHGNPVNDFALIYSNNVRKTIVKIIDEWFFLVKNLANKQAKPQKIANIDGKITIANGMSTLW